MVGLSHVTSNQENASITCASCNVVARSTGRVACDSPAAWRS